MAYKTLEISTEPRTVCDVIQYFLSSKCRDWETGDRYCKLSQPYSKLRWQRAEQRVRHDLAPPTQIDLYVREERRLDSGQWVINGQGVLVARLRMRPTTPTDWLLDVWPSSSVGPAEAGLIDQVTEMLQRTRGRANSKQRMGMAFAEEPLDWLESEQKAREFQRLVAKGKSEQEAADLLGYPRNMLRDWCKMAGLKLKKPHNKRPKRYK